MFNNDFSQRGSSSSDAERDALARALFIGQILSLEVVSDATVEPSSCIGFVMRTTAARNLTHTCPFGGPRCQGTLFQKIGVASSGLGVPHWLLSSEGIRRSPRSSFSGATLEYGRLIVQGIISNPSIWRSSQAPVSFLAVSHPSVAGCVGIQIASLSISSPENSDISSTLRSTLIANST